MKTLILLLALGACAPDDSALGATETCVQHYECTQPPTPFYEPTDIVTTASLTEQEEWSLHYEWGLWCADTAQLTDCPDYACTFLCTP